MHEDLNGKTVLITGGNGLIGTALGWYLIKTYPEIKIRFLDLCTEVLPGCEWYKISIMDKANLELACRGVDYIIHLAAALGVDNTDSDKMWCLEVNIQGTLNLLETAAKAGVKKFVFSSSSEVYGDCPQLPITEESPLNPKSVYAISKLAGEQYVSAYHDRYGIDYAIIRFFNVYGPRQDERFVLSHFVNALIRSREVQIYGDGQQVRAFCHVDDAVEGVRLALTESVANGQTVNIGNPNEPINLLDLYNLVARGCGSKLKPSIAGFSEEGRLEHREIFKRYPSIEKARRLLGYEPKISLAEGVKSLVDYHRSKMEKGNK